MTNSLFWRSGLVAALLNVGLAALLAGRVRRERFAGLAWGITAVSAICYGLLWTAVIAWAWDWFYSFVFPAWVQSFPFVFSLPYGAAGFFMWWLARRLPGRPSLNFAWLGGLEGLLTHVWAVYGLGALDKPPIMQGVDAAPVLVFACFEKMLYWNGILLVTAVIDHVTTHLKNQHTRLAT